MSGYGCSESTGGCGKRFRSLEGFDRHMHRDPDGLPWCLTTVELPKRGWVQDGAYWLSPRDQKARTRLTVGTPLGLGDSPQAAFEAGNASGGER